MSQPFKASVPKPAATNAPQRPGSFPVSQRALAVIVCFIVGIFLIGWRAVTRSDTERSLAQDRIQGPAARLKAELSHALSATEALAVHVRQGAGHLPAFQKVASELLPQYPGLVSLEILPGGVVADVAPRIGGERIMGYSIMRDPATSLAIQLRRLVITGPVRLPGGQVGLIGRLPIFLTDANGRESFWGFVSASIALPAIVSEAKLEDLLAQGYDYVLYSLPAPPQKPVSIVTRVDRGDPDLSKMVDQSISVANLEMRLAVLRRGGWGHASSLFLDILLLAFVAGGLSFCQQVRQQNKRIQSGLAESSARLSQEKERSAQLENQVRTLEEAIAAERDLARGTAESLRGQMADMEHQLQLNQQHSGHLEEELRLAKETGAVVLSSARKTAETLQSRLREVELQLSQEKEEGNRLRDELRTAQEQIEKGSSEVLQAKESALAGWKKAEAELQRARERLAQVEEEQRELAKRYGEADQKGRRLAQVEEELLRVKESSVAELNKAREASESIGAKLQEAEGELQKSREQSNGLKEELSLALAKVEELLSAQPNQPIGSESPKLISESTTEMVGPVLPTSIVEAKEGDAAPGQATALPALPELDSIEQGMEPIEDSSVPGSALIADSELDSIMDRAPEPEREAAQEAESVTELPAEVSPEPVLEPKADLPEAPKIEKTPSRKKNKDHAQLDLFGEPPIAPEKSKSPPKPEEENHPEASSHRKLTHPPGAEKTKSLPPLNKTAFKKHVTELYTLLAESDPGAQDCLADTREDLRPAFSPESFAEFENLVNTLSCPEALQLLTKTARRHGVSL